MITDAQCQEIWYTALEKEIGVAIALAAEDIHKTKVQLYTVRRSLADERLDILSIFEPNPIDGVHELFIIKRTAKLPDA